MMDNQKVSVKVDYIDLKKLSKYPDNPRKITDDDLDELCKSILEDPVYFETRPIICSNRTGSLVIIAGEKRFLAALKNGMKKAPVVVIPNLSEEDEKRILFKDNGSFGEWDLEALKQWDGFDFSQLSSWGVDINFFGDDIGMIQDDSNDELKIANDNFEQATQLNYLQFPGYKVAITDDELELLKSKVDQYMSDNGTLIGFATFLICGHE